MMIKSVGQEDEAARRAGEGLAHDACRGFPLVNYINPLQACVCDVLFLFNFHTRCLLI